jgi:hypothetical protein
MESTSKISYSLIKKRNFWTGFSSILCIAGDPHKFNYSTSSFDADTKAIGSDWQAIGKDFLKALSPAFKTK